MPRVTCIAATAGAAERMAVALQGILPHVAVEGHTADMLPHADAPDCVLAIFGKDNPGALATVERYRARGGEAAVVLVLDAPELLDRESAAMLGISALVNSHALASDLFPVLERVFTRHAPCDLDDDTLPRYLRQCHTLLAAGRTASRLPHRLNNPLAALLAEAELLRLEPLSEGQRESVDRILELSHRLIGEVRALEGVPSVSA